MIALTVRQPWADAIAHGGKRIENRTWPVPAKHVGARILIHAGAVADRYAVLPAEVPSRPIGWPGTRSAVVAVATLVGSHLATGRCCGPWGFPEVFHWQLADVTALTDPVPCKGRLGLWTPPADVIAAATAHTEETAA